MFDKIQKLNEAADFLRKMNSKIVLLRLMKQAQTEYEKCDYDSGRQTLVQALKIDKKNHMILRQLGCICQFSGKMDSAIRYFKAALKYSDTKEIEYTLIGMVYYFQNKLDDAVKYFNLAIDENGNYSQAYDARNQTILENHLKIVDLQEALKEYL